MLNLKNIYCLLFQVIMGVVIFIFPICMIAQPGTVKSHLKISDITGGFTGILDDGDFFGGSVNLIGDLDGDGIKDFAVGAGKDDDGGTDRGAVYILLMNSDGTVKSHQKISDIVGGFTGILDDTDHFGGSRTSGSGIASLGDLDGDGVIDIAVGSQQDDDGGVDRGAVYILFLNSNGTVKAHQKISSTAGAFNGIIRNNDGFGNAVAAIGDLDGDGIIDLAVGGAGNDGPGNPSTLSLNFGAIWILFLNNDGTVKANQKIGQSEGGFTGTLNASGACCDEFGRSIDNLGDLDGDGITDLAVGAYQDDDGGTDRGAIYILFLNTNGTVKSHQKISDTQGGFSGTLDNGDRLGSSVSAVGDLDGDGITDMASGVIFDDDGGTNRGAVWILFLNNDGTVKTHQKISDTDGGFTGVLDDDDFFGWTVSFLGDFDGDGVSDLAVGVPLDDDGGNDRGAVWILLLKGSCTPFAVDAGSDQTVYFGYPDENSASASLNATASGGTLPYSFSWTPAAGLDDATSPNPQATLGASNTTFTVTVTDANGCIDSDDVTICVNNVVCKVMNTNYKVYVCHADNTLCIAVNAVASHLAHGDRLGTCESAFDPCPPPPGNTRKVQNTFTSWSINAFPSPFSHQTRIKIIAPEFDRIRLDALDMNGRQVRQVFEGEIQAGSFTHAIFDGTGLNDGIYLIRLTTSKGVQFSKVVLVR